MQNAFYERQGEMPWCSRCEKWEEDCVCGVQDWPAIAAQLDYWRDMDLDYWRQRREQEYEAYLTRQLQ